MASPTSRGPAPAPPIFQTTSDAAARWRALAALSLAELLRLSLWFSASAVLPALSREWDLGAGGRAALMIALQLGFIAGTLLSALGNLPDVWSSRRLMIGSAVGGAAASAAVALWVHGLVTGVSLAGV